MNNSTWFEYYWIKTIKLFGSDWNSQIKRINYCDFYLLISNSVETCKNGTKMTKSDKNDHYLTLFKF